MEAKGSHIHCFLTTSSSTGAQPQAETSPPVAYAGDITLVTATDPRSAVSDTSALTEMVLELLQGKISTHVFYGPIVACTVQLIIQLIKSFSFFFL